ncbi:hypothetical protein BDW75DRAFT_239202 [Aspergillus navahoensis]
MGSIGAEKTFHCDVLILGLKVKVFEAGGDLGGVWYWNRYPGARVDSEWSHYQLSIPEVWKDFYFTERFPSHDEIRSYFHHVDKVLDLKKDMQFNARVNSATWDASKRLWTVTTEAGHVGVAKYLCLFTGLLHRQYLPNFPGFDKFKGQVYHSSAWPGDVDVTGKKELSKKASHLAMFMRRPSICMPLGNRGVTRAEQDSWKPYFKHLFDAGRKSSAGGIPIIPPTKGIFELSDARREEYYETLWKSGSFHFGGGNFPEIFTDRRANRIAYDFWAKKTRARFTNPVKRDLMAPRELQIVPLLQTPFESFTETGITTADGKHREFDIIVCATGFESFTGSVATMNVKSKDGVDMKDIWTQGIRTYLGMLVHGFPSCFLSYSSHAPTALSNGPTILECQVDFIVDVISKMEQEGLDTIEPTAEAEEDWRQRIVESGINTLFTETDSWWTKSNIPGRKRELLTYIGGIPQYEAECRATFEGWKGFEVTKHAT